MIPIRHTAFLYLSRHGRIHKQLDAMERRYRDLLHGIEEKEIAAYDDDATFGRLEQLKRELIRIRFMEEGKKEGS